MILHFQERISHSISYTIALESTAKYNRKENVLLFWFCIFQVKSREIFEEAVRVLKPEGEILVAYSFGGEVIDSAKDDVVKLLQKNGLKLEKLKSSNKGVFILGKKEK